MNVEITSQRESPSNMMLIQQAIADGKVDLVRELVALQQSTERFSWEREERQIKIDFDESLSRCQAKLKPIGADMANPQTHSKYASYAALDKAVRPLYTEEGFSISFGEDEGSTADYIVMLAYLSRGGHTRTYRKGMPIDTKGPKGNDVMTKTHAAGSGGSYAKRYLLKDIFNLAVGEDDDDGNGMVVTEAIAKTVSEMLRCTDLETLKDKYRTEYKAAMEANDSTAVKLFMDAYTKRKGELS